MLTRYTKKLLVIVFGSFLIHSSGAAHAAAPAGPTKMSPEAKPVEHDPKVLEQTLLMTTNHILQKTK